MGANLVNVVDVDEDGEDLDVVVQRNSGLGGFRKVRNVFVRIRIFRFVLFLDPLEDRGPLLRAVVGVRLVVGGDHALDFLS